MWRRRAFGALLGLGAAALPVSIASAGEPDRGPPPLSWTGFYVGVNAGWAWTDVSGEAVFFPAAGFSTFGTDVDGIALGIHGGFQYQWRNIVAGVEIGWTPTLDWGSTAGAGGVGDTCDIATTLACEARLHHILQIGARLGWAADRWLVYATGGLAQAEIQTRARVIGGGVLSSLQETHPGWFVGGGLEFLLNRHLVFGIEYQHLQFDTETHLDVASPNNSRFIDATSDIVRARLSLKLN
jgi:outer membrane immunogenic protein